MRKKQDEVETPIGGDVVIISGEKYPVSPELLAIKDDYDRLTERQRKWLDAYLVNRNATEAARTAGYSGADGTLRRMGKANKDKLLYMVEIIDEIGGELVQAVTELTGIYSFWGETMVNKSMSTRDRLKASELLARALGAFDGENGDTNIFINTEATDKIPSDVLEAFIISNTIEGETTHAN